MHKVLIIEDDLMLADILEEVLSDEGFDVCGIAQSPAEALVMAAHFRPDLAIVDVQLKNGLGTDITATLMELYTTGILYTTGNIAAVVGAAGHACLPKPCSLRDAAWALRIVAEIKRTGTASPPFPTGLRLLAVES